MDRKNRQSGIELLRLLAGCCVVLLHYNYYGGTLDGSTGINHQILRTLETLAVPAVNVFLLIFGYFHCKKTQIHPGRAVRLLLQVSVFRVLITLVRGLLQGKILWKSVIISLLPINYFAVFYVTLYLISPFLNSFLLNMSQKNLKNLGIWLFVLFSIYPTCLDIVQKHIGTDLSGLYTVGDGGYTIVNFFLCYYIGAFLRLTETTGKVSSKKALVGYFVCFLILNIWDRLDPGTAREYCNPILIMEASCIFIVFARFSFYSGAINSLARSSFTCFLLHFLFIPYIHAEEAATGSTAFLLGHLVVSIIGIYMICWIADIVYRKISEPVFRWIDAKLPCYGCD